MLIVYVSSQDFGIYHICSNASLIQFEHENGISYSYQLDQSIYFLSVGWYFLFLFKFCNETVETDQILLHLI